MVCQLQDESSQCEGCIFISKLTSELQAHGMSYMSWQGAFTPIFYSSCDSNSDSGKKVG